MLYAKVLKLSHPNARKLQLPSLLSFRPFLPISASSWTASLLAAEPGFSPRAYAFMPQGEQSGGVLSCSSTVDWQLHALFLEWERSCTPFMSSGHPLHASLTVSCCMCRLWGSKQATDTEIWLSSAAGRRCHAHGHRGLRYSEARPNAPTLA